ncbi:hypothetical protein V2I75_26430 [Pseudomonas viridiflava]|uniref:CdiA C-terminal domain-containing protein n=1 Tax=Pseudomonas viridiflava TaxID=33069 RepID=UPI002EC0AABF|nr:hypothetical protein [Pseudomonas viridiflava]
MIDAGLFVTAALTGVLASGKYKAKSKTISAEMKADPYHPDWKNYSGTDRGVGADRVNGGSGAKGVLRIDPNGSFTQSEINSAYYMAAQGKKVELRSPVGTRAEGNTSDLLVDGVRYDVYTPTTGNAARIISAIAKKNTQTEGIVLDLSKSSVTREQLGDVLRRVNGSGAKKTLMISLL